MLEIYKAEFYIEGGPRYTGLTAGRRWNGWATPHFTREEGERLIAAMNEDYTREPLKMTGKARLWDIDKLNELHRCYYDEEQDAFVIPLYDGTDTPEVEVYKASVTGVYGDIYPEPLYAIGAGVWTWDGGYKS